LVSASAPTDGNADRSTVAVSPDFSTERTSVPNFQLEE
jgi:hypothetical protein